MSDKVIIDKSKLELILNLAREGEAQVVAYSKDHHLMAIRAAELSRQRCGRIIEEVLDELS